MAERGGTKFLDKVVNNPEAGSSDPNSPPDSNNRETGPKKGQMTLNFNVGVLGHIDSGKTSLVKVLSTVASTACFDKNPQSQERGITLDLGFSSFVVDLPDHMLGTMGDKYNRLQFTLVDCPGHASLIRTIIGGAQIIDMMLLVVDVTKGVQTQTAECLVIGEITCEKMIVILNKIDLLAEDKRSSVIERMTKRLLKTLETTKFAGSLIIPVSARPGGPEGGDVEAFGVTQLIDALKLNSYLPKRNTSGSFLFAVDHCFSIKGQGTVMTGTVISGSLNVNDNVEIPTMKITKKIKSMQMFKKPVNSAVQGDRVGICVTQFDPKQLERGLICTPGSLPTVTAAIIRVSKISYFKGTIASRAKFHITIGHDTVMGRGTFFGRTNPTQQAPAATDEFDFGVEYMYQDELYSTATRSPSEGGAGEAMKLDASWKAEENSKRPIPTEQFVLLEFESPITCAQNFLVIGSKLDTDVHSNACRLAFHGRLVRPITEVNYAESVLPQLKVFKDKRREGVVERRADEYTLVCGGLFKKETDMKVFAGLKVYLSTGDQGVIEGGFGQSGKFKVRIPNGLGEEASSILVTKAGKKNKSKSPAAAEQTVDTAAGPDPLVTTDGVPQSASIRVILDFKRYIYDPHKKIIQK